MVEFLAALTDPSIPFLRHALWAGLLSSVTFGVVGTYITIKRISYLVGAIAHATLLGIGVALYAQRVLAIQWLTPLIGALLSGMPAALVIGLIHLYAREREDTVIGAVWVIGMAGGLLLIARTPGYTDPTAYLFGTILILSVRELLAIGLLDDLVVLAIVLLFHRHINAVIFDEEFSRVRGLPVAHGLSADPGDCRPDRRADDDHGRDHYGDCTDDAAGGHRRPLRAPPVADHAVGHPADDAPNCRWPRDQLRPRSADWAGNHSGGGPGLSGDYRPAHPLSDGAKPQEVCQPSLIRLADRAMPATAAYWARGVLGSCRGGFSS